MSKRKGQRRRSVPAKSIRKGRSPAPMGSIDPAETAQRERYFERFLIVTFLVFGIYQSVLYFGHKVVPISDFPDIVKVGHDLLSFRLPARFKQAPVVGLLQASLSYLVGGQHPDLTAGWLLNAMLHPLNLLLFWLVAREIVGRAAAWFAVVAIVNYWVIYMLTEPIMETTLLFFVLLTFYLIFRRSKWCYAAASVTTMVRYEGAALILAAFVIDMIHSTGKRDRIRALLRSAAAGIPLAVWMLGTLLTFKSDPSHYLRVFFTKEYSQAFSGSVEGRRGILMHMRLLWTVGFRALLMPVAAAKAVVTDTRLNPLTAAEREAVKIIFGLCQTAALAGFTFGAVYGLIKRQWKILALLIFFVPYFLLHAMYPYPLQRFHSTIFWIAVLICLFGFQSLWRLTDANGRIPRILVAALQVALIVTAVVWFLLLIPYVLKVGGISPRSASLPWVAMGVMGCIFAARLLVDRARHILREASILACSCLILASNQLAVAPLLNDGQREAEFKLLADWYIANAKDGEKMGVYMAGVVKIFAPKYAEYFVRLPEVGSPPEFDPQQFVEACYKEKITYVVWATREGLSNDHTGYRRLGLHKNIGMLNRPRSSGEYEFVAQVRAKRGLVHIFRLKEPGDPPRREIPG